MTTFEPGDRVRLVDDSADHDRVGTVLAPQPMTPVAAMLLERNPESAATMYGKPGCAIVALDAENGSLVGGRGGKRICVPAEKLTKVIGAELGLTRSPRP